ncbi:alginate regulatory protein [Sphingobium indicum IP26]|uniref:MucR family transcriptional regulator n=1 Tax=Sphingobium sp. HDIP04 TaxID=428994 RepID=UPI000365A536|nr:MucR family transcriptional regulator [Sphingobium sp. HDIP04]EPR15134.1 alginate regulatory protein [Sphingobium indicum IP26]EQB09334.1 alginate regulatory protein [Sphingobium sp. HDIP04]
MSENNQPDITTLTVQLVSAFVSNNNVASEGLADLIRTTRLALTDDLAAKPEDAAAPTYTPAVSVRKSLSSPEHILSMIDGRPYKTLKRHLASHGLTPNEYRERYGLPKSYPLVAPNYSEARRAVATKLGLGKKPVSVKKPAEAAPAPAVAAPAAAKPAAAPKAALAKAAPAKPAVAKTPAPKTAATKAPAAKPAEAKSPAAKPVEAKPAVAKASAAKAPAAKPATSRKRLSIATPSAPAPKKDAAPAAKPAEKAAAGNKPAPAAKAPAKPAPKKKPAAKSSKATVAEKA